MTTDDFQLSGRPTNKNLSAHHSLPYHLDGTELRGYLLSLPTLEAFY